MSRVGRKPISIPSGVKVAVTNDVVSIQGPKGKLDYNILPRFEIEVKDNKITVKRPSEDRHDVARHGLTRSLLQNMIIGVTEGYKKELEIRGVGFKSQVQGNKLTLNLGYSHQIVYEAPEGVTIESGKTGLTVKGIDKAKVGTVASVIRSFYLPEPYKGKGVRYVGEYVRHKAGKKVA